MKLLPLLLLCSCTQGVTVRYDYYPACTLTCTVGKDGKLINRPVTMEATYETTWTAHRRCLFFTH